MHRIGLGKPHVAIDTAATVPAGVRLVGVVHPYCHHVLALSDIRCDVVLETRITVGSVTHLLAIHIDRGIHIHTIELQEELFTFHFSAFHFKVLTVPTDTTRQGTTACPTGITHIEVTFDGPVVRHIETAPVAVVEICLRHNGRVA